MNQAPLISFTGRPDDLHGPDVVADVQVDLFPNHLKQHYTEDEIAKIIAVIALFGFLNRWNDTIRTDIEEIHAT